MMQLTADRPAAESQPAEHARILVVEDRPEVLDVIQRVLADAGYEVHTATDGDAALAAALDLTPDLLVLDVGLPKQDGFSVTVELRRRGFRAPVLLLTVRGAVSDKVTGLEAGADDYLAKPFDLPVLLARVKGLLRRRDWARGAAGDASPETARVGEAEVDFRRFEVRNPGGTFRLTLLETMLLKLLVQNAGRVVSKGEILEKVWNVSPDTATRAVDNFIVRLRKYIEADPRLPKHLHTVRGAGYKLVLEA